MTTEKKPGNPRTIVLCGVDISAAKVLDALQRAAIAAGHRVHSMLNVPKSGMYVASEQLNPDVLVTGMSSAIALFGDDTELRLGRGASVLKIPWFVVADTHGSWGRPPAKGQVGNATVFVVSPSEIEPAKQFGYGAAECLGLPLHWEAARKFRWVQVLNRPFTICYEGMKYDPINLAVLETIVEGAKQALAGKSWQLRFVPHENVDKPKTPEEGEAWQKRMDNIRQSVTVVGMPERKSRLEVMAQDNLLCFTSGGGGVPPACIMGAPVAYFTSEAVDQRMINQTGRPDAEWTPVKEGAVSVFRNPGQFADIIAQAADSDARRDLNRRQERVYPKSIQALTAERLLERILQPLVA